MKLLPRRFPAPMQPALTQLLQAHDCAAEVGRPAWDFAVGIATLHDGGLSDIDRRWLTCRGYVAHARERIRPGARHRTFGRGSGLSFARQSCFVLTDAGVAAARACGWPADTGGPPSLRLAAGKAEADPGWRPRWDGAARDPRLGGSLIKCFRQPAPSQEAILAAFEMEGWPERVADPLPPDPQQEPKVRLQRTVNNLNRAHHARLLCFFASDNGEAVGLRLLRGAGAGETRARPERNQSETRAKPERNQSDA